MFLAGTYLIAAFLGGYLARLLMLPPLLGFLVAGFVLKALDVPDHPLVDSLANLGVTLMLFVVGLELDIRQLLRREVWLTTLVQTTVMVALGVALFNGLMLLGFGLLAGTGPDSWIPIALALSFSSTVFVIKMLEERNEARSRYGQIAIGILVMQDLIAVLYVALSSGELPSLWSITLFLLLPARKLIVSVWKRMGHGEMLVLLTMVLAIEPGYLLFESVGLKGDLGAVAMGMLMASHPRAHELAHSIFSLKELLLVAFFLSIGLHGLPSWSQVGLGLLLLLLLPLQGVCYFLLISRARMRWRTAILTALVMTNNSEFALVLASTGIGAGLLAPEWLTTVSVSVAASFVIGSLVNMKAEAITDAIERRWPDTDLTRLDPSERPVPLEGIDVLVLGMGRVGRACYQRLAESGYVVFSIEHDEERVEQLKKEGFNVLHGDAVDGDLWRRLQSVSTLRKVILAMPFHNANLDALEVARLRGFDGSVAAICQWPEEIQELHAAGADEVIYLYTGAGAALADAAMGGQTILQVMQREEDLLEDEVGQSNTIDFAGK